jgi:dinuclear metal center YbgI/SA1388 family protein
MQLSDLLIVLEELWPAPTAEQWDRVGLVSGSSAQEINRILLTVDVTAEVVAEAVSGKFDLIISHHPLLLKGITTVSEDTSKGSLLATLIKSNIALYAAHTNADVSKVGTSVVLANQIGLSNQKVLVKNADGSGIGILGELSPELSLGKLAGKLNAVLPATATGVRVAGDYERLVTKVALCAGAGDSYLQAALEAGADVYITSDLRHHPAQEILEQAKARGLEFALIDISHWAAEFLWLEQACKEILAKISGPEIVISEIRTDVFDFLMNVPRG